MWIASTKNAVAKCSHTEAYVLLFFFKGEYLWLYSIDWRLVSGS
jgi:hypothetical protein